MEWKVCGNCRLTKENNDWARLRITEARSQAYGVVGGLRQQEAVRGGTYERSSGVAGCDPLRLCAKLRFPVPVWREAFWSPAPPMDTPPPPNADHPEPLLAVMSVVSGSDQARAGPPPRSSYPSFRRLVSYSTPNVRVVEVVGVVAGLRSPLAYHASFGVPLLVAAPLAPKFLSRSRLRVCVCANCDKELKWLPR